jgi:hypothetical protein
MGIGRLVEIEPSMGVSVINIVVEEEAESFGLEMT